MMPRAGNTGCHLFRLAQTHSPGSLTWAQHVTARAEIGMARRVVIFGVGVGMTLNPTPLVQA